MCQCSSIPIDATSIIGYRVYTKNEYRKYVSFYHSEPLPEINKITIADDGPFHAFKTIKDVKYWFDIQMKEICTPERVSLEDAAIAKKIMLATIKIYKVLLSDLLEEGFWNGSQIETITGYSCTILEEINTKEDE